MRVVPPYQKKKKEKSELPDFFFIPSHFIFMFIYILVR
jgi:hypothetical protein